MNRLLNRLLLWHKFAILGIFAFILFMAPLALYLHESNKSVAAAAREAEGLPPARAVLKVVLLTQQHRGLSALMLSGDAAAPAQRAAKQDEVEKAFAAAEAVVKQTGDSAIVSQWSTAKSGWSALAGKLAQGGISAPESFTSHTSLVGELLKVNELIVDHYGLALDPEAETYYLIDVALLQSPALMETLGRMRAKGATALTTKNPSIEDRGALIAMQTKADELYGAIRKSLDKAGTANPALKSKLNAPLQATQDIGKQALQLTQEQIVKAEQLSFAAPDYFAKMTEAIGAQLKLYDAAVNELGAMLDARESALVRTKYELLGAILLLALFAAWFGYLITRSITAPLGQAVGIAQRVASGDLSAHIVVDSQNETGQLLQALKDMNDSLVRIVTEVRNGTETIATASSQIAAGNMDLSARTEEQASSLEETASSMEEITGTVQQNADNARQANQLARSASEVAAKGGGMVTDVVETMGSINESSKKIVDIIAVIDGIAFQTNILALNAAVEAARAGEQGRGFAVVAGEVRSLAQRSAAAAKEIKELINASVERVAAGTRLAGETGATMTEVVAGIQRVSDIIGEITAASNEQTSGIEQVNLAIAQMDETTQQNASLVEEAAAAADALKNQAQSLTQVVGVFKLAQQDAFAVAEVPVHVAHAPSMQRQARQIRQHS
jgi:methyl-accepting chemotaxis protein